MDKLSPGDEILVKRWPVFLGVAAFLALCFFALKPILTPFVAGALVAYFGDPVVDILERRRINRTVGVAIVFAVFTLLMTVLVLFTLPRVAVQIDALSSHRFGGGYAGLAGQCGTGASGRFLPDARLGHSGR